MIASADGIDYMESSSAQGVSTITVHLKLNYDANAALTQLQAKVAQVRNDLPPEAQAPIIDLQTADTQFASMYLGFASKELDQNQITDYLTRVVQPKLSAVSGVQRADILGRARLRDAGLAEAREDGGARHLAVAGPRPPRQQQLPVGAREPRRAPWCRSTSSPTRACRRSRSSSSSSSSRTRGTSSGSREIADVVLGAEDYNQEVRFNGQTATFMGIWVLPTANSLDVVKRVREPR